jgi:hypothetical protein
MKAWKKHPNLYDDNLVKCHDDNSAINTLRGVITRLPAMQASEAAALTPAAWLAARQGRTLRQVA